jgi:3-deoxy-7-phosphoheptulonate synthase
MNRKAHRTEERTADTVVSVGGVRFGADPFPVVAGPCTIESEEQIHHLAGVVADAGARVLRGNSVATMVGGPYAFQGLGLDGVRMLAEAGRAVGLPTLTQIAEPRDAEAVAEHVDMVEVGSGNMQNFELLRAVGQTGLPVMLKRSPSATFDEWLWAAEYVLAEGNDQVVLCERGIRAFEKSDTLDIAAVPTIKETSHLPVVVFPSHAVTDRVSVRPLALAAQGVGADGLVVEVHDHPEHAPTNGIGQLEPDRFDELMGALGINRLRGQVDLIDRDIVRLLARRRHLTSRIGRVKAERGMPVYVPAREEELLDVVREEAKLQGLADAYVVELFEIVLADSKEAQRRDRAGSQ